MLHMRRLLALFLLVLLPLQFSWAAVGAYCQHETGTPTRHFGHHDHQHKADPDQGDSAVPDMSGGIDNDCSACHAGCCAAAILGDNHLSAQQVASDAIDGYRNGLAPPPTYQPERPNWVALA